MKEVMNAEVSVVKYISSKQKQAVQHVLYWQNKDCALGKVIYYHNYLEGRNKDHIF